jgi:hypothetical protein
MFSIKLPILVEVFPRLTADVKSVNFNYLYRSLKFNKLLI